MKGVRGENAASTHSTMICKTFVQPSHAADRNRDGRRYAVERWAAGNGVPGAVLLEAQVSVTRDQPDLQSSGGFSKCSAVVLWWRCPPPTARSAWTAAMRRWRCMSLSPSICAAAVRRKI